MIELTAKQIDELIEANKEELTVKCEEDIEALRTKLTKDIEALRLKVKKHYEELLNKPVTPTPQPEPDKKKKRKLKTHIWTTEERQELIIIKSAGTKPNDIATEFLKDRKKDKTLTKARVLSKIRTL